MTKMRADMTEKEKKRLDSLTLLAVFAEMHKRGTTPEEPYDHELFRDVGEQWREDPADFEAWVHGELEGLR